MTTVNKSTATAQALTKSIRQEHRSNDCEVYIRVAARSNGVVRKRQAKASSCQVFYGKFVHEVYG